MIVNQEPSDKTVNTTTTSFPVVPFRRSASARSTPGAPVAPFYETPFEFTGTIHSVTFDVSGDVIGDSEAEMRVIMARQ